jgi:hypothetical protein
MSADTAPALDRLEQARARLSRMARCSEDDAPSPWWMLQSSQQVEDAHADVYDDGGEPIARDLPDETAWLISLISTLDDVLLEHLDEAIEVARGGGAPPETTIRLATCILETGRPGYQCDRGICAAGEGHTGSCAEASGWNEGE